jgi:Ca-activated chloride channel family protein
MAANMESQAYKHYANKDWSAAAAGYKQLSGYAARFGEAASHYKMADFNSAIQQFIQATLEANNDTERASALLNLGNSYFQLGDYLRAETAYRDTLLYRPADPRAQHNLAFTSGLKQTVEARRQQAARARAARMGRGPQRALAEGSVETRENSALAVDEGETTEPGQLALPELADVSDETLELLVQKGLQQIQLAAQQSPAEKRARYQRDQRAYADARLRMTELQDRQAQLWKRLFEIEEGFTAPQTEPHTMPGVNPW